MSVNKIDISVVERIAPNRGPTSSSDYNATIQELINDLTRVSLSWNNEVQPLLDSLPTGNTNIIREERSDNPNPFINGFDGSQIYLDLTSTTLTDNGKYFDKTLDRPLTIKESLENIQDQLNDAIQELQVEIAQVNLNSGITSRQKQSLGSRIFDPETTSSPTSLDGLSQSNSRSIDQMALDISGSRTYLTGSGAQTLEYSILEQLEAIKNSHAYNPIFNTLTHEHLDLHAHRYHITPIGDLNGLNKTYILPGTEKFVQGTLRVIVNGLELQKNIDYSEKPNLREFEISPSHRALENDGMGSDDNIWIHYDVEV